jgi:hypothetical protein
MPPDLWAGLVMCLAVFLMMWGLRNVSRFDWENWHVRLDYAEGMLFSGGLLVGLGIGIFAGGALFSLVR